MTTRKKPYVVIVFNEPTSSSEDVRRYVSDAGVLQSPDGSGRTHAEPAVDLSEVGVLEEKEDIAKALQSLGYRSSIFNVDGDISRLVNFLKDERPDAVFNLCESVGNEAIHEMHVAGIYELMKIPYTGSGPLALGMCLDKVMLKQILCLHGLPTPRFQLFKSPVKMNLSDDMQFPLIVKPSHEDASVGIEPASVVYNMAELRKRVRWVIERFDEPALVEEYIDGRELNVAILGTRKPKVLPISEIDMSTLPKQYPRIITYNAKWLKGTEEYENTKGVCPALLPPELETSIKEMALRLFQLMGCRDYARIDVRLSKDHQPYILELNPNPDISDDAGFARSARVAGYKFEEFIREIVESALERAYL
jgi:D-alanine-D-alanine ligase